MSNWHGGKGSARRSKKDDKYLENWEKIFGKKKISILDLKNVIEIKNKSKQHGTK